VDFEQMILEEGGVLYLDPPYYVKGNDLYQCGFTEEDHHRLAESLRNTSNPWILSYDDCPEVRELYQWAKYESVDVNYSITGNLDKKSDKRKSRTKPELIIYPASHLKVLEKRR
jgi:DNA adenine methylase